MERLLVFLFFGMDLLASDVMIQPETVHELAGPWEFHWKKMIGPAHVMEHTSTIIPAARKWTQAGFESHGFGSYVLRVRGFAQANEIYTLYFSSVSTAMRVFAFPEHAPEKFSTAMVGNVSEILGQTKSSALPLQLNIMPSAPNEPWIFILNVSNATEASGGGLMSAPKLGGSRSIQMDLWKGFLVESMVIGFVIAIMIYNILLFIRQKSDRSSLALGLGCFGIVIRTFALSPNLHLILGSDKESFYTAMKFLEYLSVPISCLGFYYFFVFAYSKEPLVWISRTYNLLVGFLVIIACSFNIKIITASVAIFQIVPLLSSGITVYVLQKAFREKQEGVWYSFIGFFAMLATVFYDIAAAYGHLPQPMISQYGIALFLFFQSQVVAKRFASAFKTASFLTAELKDEVARQTAQIRHLMDIIPQGILTLHAGLKIGDTYSKAALDIFKDEDIGSSNVIERMRGNLKLTEENLSFVESVFNSSLGEDSINWEMNRQLLPAICESRDKRKFAFEWHAVENAGIIMEVLVTVRDITDIMKLKAEHEKNEKELRLLKEFYGISRARIQNYFLQNDQLLAQCATSLNDFGKLLTILHTIKGNSRQLGLSTVSMQVHDLESLIQNNARGSTCLNAALQELLSLWKTYKDVMAKLHGNDSEHMHSISFSRDDWERLSTEFKSHDPDKQAIARIIKRSGFPTLQDDLLQSTDYLRKLATSLQKAAPRLTVSIPDITLETMQHEALQKAWIHLINNSLDHGIEQPSERLEAGKSEEGHISLQAHFDEKAMTFRYCDDGRGLNVKRLYEKALAKNLIFPSKDIDTKEAVELIFASGLSTSDDVTEVSGRGVGMGAVRSFIEEAGGKIRLELDDKVVDAKGFIKFAVVIVFRPPG